MITRLKKSFAAQGLTYSIDLVKTILLVPFFITNWGLESYGSYLTSLSFLALLMSLDNGFGLYVSNEYNLLYHKDVKKAKQLISSAFKVVILSNLIQTIFVFSLIMLQLNFSFFFIEIDILYALLVLCFYRLLIGSSKGLLVKTLFPIGYFHKSSLIGTSEKIVEILVLIPFVLYNNSFLKAIIFISIFKSIYCVVSIFLINKWTKVSILRIIKLGNLRKGLMMYKKSIPLMFNSFFDKSTNDGINTIISITLGPIILPIYTTTKTLANILLKFMNLIFHPFIPELGRLYSKNENEKIVVIFRFLILFICIVFLPMLFFSYYSEYVYNFWLNHKLEFNNILFGTLISSSFMYLYGKIFISYFISINHVRALTYISLIRGLGILSLTYLFLYFFGFDGLGWSNLIVEIFSFILICFFIYKFWKNKSQLFSKNEIYIYAINILFTLFGLFISSYFNNLPSIVIISLFIIIINFKSIKESYKSFINK